MKLEKGFVKNMTHLWAHTMKRAVGPGAKISLKELYEQYGRKYNLEPDVEFVRWLRDVKLRDRNKWQIFTDENKPFEEITVAKKEELKAQGETVKQTDKSKGENVAPVVVKGIEVGDIVELSVRKAREVVPEIHDIKLLKYALAEANQRTGKDSLCRILRKRIDILAISARR